MTNGLKIGLISLAIAALGGYMIVVNANDDKPSAATDKPCCHSEKAKEAEKAPPAEPKKDDCCDKDKTGDDSKPCPTESHKAD